MFGDFTASEDEHETHPLRHDFEPFIESLLHRGEGVEFRLYLCPEGRNAASGEHLNEVHSVLFKLFLVFINAATDCAREVVVLVWSDVKFSYIPIGINFFTKLLLDLHLLESGVADVLNILLDYEKVCLE